MTPTESVPRPVMLLLSIVAGIHAVASAAVFAELVGRTGAAATLAVLAGIDIALATYLQSRVVPVESTIAYERRGRIRAGGAAVKPIGSVVNDELTIGRLAGKVTNGGGEQFFDQT